MISVFHYLDPATFLADSLEEKRLKNPSFSLRSWAIALGMKSHGPLHAMIKGQRSIPKKYIPLLIKSLSQTGNEAKFFELLIDLQKAKTNQEKEYYLEMLKDLSPKKMREVTDIETYKYITEPLHIIISEMTQLKNFKNSLAWIKLRLRAQANLKEIEEIIHRLENLGILESIKGKLVKKVAHIYTAKEVMSEAVQLYHKKMGALAIEQISEQAIDAREFNAISFNIKKQDLPKIKKAIREFSDEFVQNFEAKSGEGEETYHLNIQFFSLTKE